MFNPKSLIQTILSAAILCLGLGAFCQTKNEYQSISVAQGLSAGIGNLFMSHSKLHRKLDALTGCSPNKFIRIIRLKKAKQLLKDDEISIASVAIDCGFSDPGYFARVFKQEFGLTPNEWRANVKDLKVVSYNHRSGPIH